MLEEIDLKHEEHGESMVKIRCSERCTSPSIQRAAAFAAGTRQIVPARLFVFDFYLMQFYGWLPLADKP